MDLSIYRILPRDEQKDIWEVMIANPDSARFIINLKHVLRTRGLETAVQWMQEALLEPPIRDDRHEFVENMYNGCLYYLSTQNFGNGN